jgi:hypothetical protein
MTHDAAAIWDIGTDIGGTFTDIVGVNTVSQETRIAKVPSRPAAPVRAMLAHSGWKAAMCAASCMARRASPTPWSRAACRKWR